MSRAAGSDQHPKASSAKRDAIALLVLALVASAVLFDVLTGSACIYFRDLMRTVYPLKHVAREIVLMGEFPFWNRLSAGGQPLAANPEHSAFYPLNWLILLPSFFAGFRLLLSVHIYIALFAMYAFLRSLDLRPHAAVFGALSFGLGGICFSLINVPQLFFGFSWLPLTCLFFRRLMLRMRLRDFVWTSLLLGLQVLVAEPTTLLQTGFLLGMYALYRGFHAARDDGLRFKPALSQMAGRVGLVALVCIVASLVGAVQLLPAIDHFGDSARSEPLPFGVATSWSMPWLRVVELVYPSFLGHVSHDGTPPYWGRSLYEGRPTPYILGIYFGLLGTILAASGILIRARGSRFVLLLVALSVWVALGANTPLWKAFHAAGLIRGIRYPEKFILIALVALIVFAAQMFDRMMEDDRLRAVTFQLACGVALVAFAVWLVTLSSAYPALFRSFWNLNRSPETMLRLSQQDWLIASVRASALALLLLALPRFRRNLGAAALLAFVAGDLALVVREYNPRMPREFFEGVPDAMRQIAAPPGNARLFHRPAIEDSPNERKYLLSGDLFPWVIRNGLYPPIPATYGLPTVLERDISRTQLLPTVELLQAVRGVQLSGRKDWWKPFLAMSNVAYVGVERPFEAERARAGRNVATIQPVEIIHAPGAPRYYFAGTIVTIGSPGDLAAQLARGDVSESVAFVRGPSFIPGRGVVHSWRETPNTATIDVESSGRGFLVMSVTPHKYWRVTIDGREIAPVITNLGYQGIVVPAGHHRVEMRYRNGLIVTGAWISAVMLMTLLAAAFRPGAGRGEAPPRSRVEDVPELA